MDEDYGRAEWRNDEAAATAEAIRRIRAAAESGADTLDFSDLSAMVRLPDELREVPRLRRLFAGDQRANGEFTPYTGYRLSDLTSLRHLSALTSLDLTRTPVADIAPLATLTALTKLILTRTPVADLAPLATLTALSLLDLSRTQVTDLAPLATLGALTSLSLRSTQVADLSILLDLPQFATERGKRLSFAATPAADPAKHWRMDMLSRLPPDRCAIETVQYLKGTHPGFRDRPNGRAPSALPARLAQASPVAVVVQDGVAVAVNTGAPERLAPRELGPRLTALRAHVAGLCEDAAELQVPQRQQARLRRYAEALAAPEPTYLLLDTPMLVLRTALADPYVTEGLDAAFVAGWRALVTMHDDLRPLLLPPDDTDRAPDLMPEVTPEMVERLADDLIADLKDAVVAGAVAPSVPEAVAAGAEMAELAREGPQVNPGRLKRAAIVVGGLVAGLRERFVTTGKVAGAGVALQKFIESPWGQAVLGKLETLWKLVEAWWKAGG